MRFRGSRKKRALPAEERRLPESKDSIREELIASYIAGTLPDGQRAEVARYLAENAEAREVLKMAHEAMRNERPDGNSS